MLVPSHVAQHRRFRVLSDAPVAPFGIIFAASPCSISSPGNKTIVHGHTRHLPALTSDERYMYIIVVLVPETCTLRRAHVNSSARMVQTQYLVEKLVDRV